VAQAENHATSVGATNVTFEVGDLFALRHDDATFDVVHAHQVLQHLADPRAALVSVSSTCWTYADPASRQWWGGLWADRVRFSRLAEQAVAYELSDTQELDSIARAFLEWAASPDAVFVVPHVEILARR